MSTTPSGNAGDEEAFYVQPHLNDPELNGILIRDFNKFTYGRWEQKFEPSMVPRQFESCDRDMSIPGRRPRFWAFVKHSACHWLCGFTLKLAMLVAPDRPWRIITSDEHSTCWDGKDLLFDFNCAVSASGTFGSRAKSPHGCGILRQPRVPDHFSKKKRPGGEPGRENLLCTRRLRSGVSHNPDKQHPRKGAVYESRNRAD
jgi:hypothetical protein